MVSATPAQKVNRKEPMNNYVSMERLERSDRCDRVGEKR